MSKRELVARTIECIRMDIETLNKCLKERNTGMYFRTCDTIADRVDFLFDLEIITLNQYMRLLDIMRNYYEL